MSRPTGLVIAAYALAALLVIPVFPHFPSPNEVTRWLLVASVVEDHTIEVTRLAAMLGPEFEDLAIVDGHVYSNKAPGAALVATPGYLLIRPFLGPPSPSNLRVALTAMRWFGATLPLLLMTIAFARFAAERGGNPRNAVTAMLFATPLLAYGLLLFSHALVGATMFGAWLLLYLRDRGGLLAGALIGIAVAAEYPTLIVAIVLVGGVVIRREWSRLARVFAGGLPFAILLAAYQKAAFGSVFATPIGYDKLPEYRALGHTGFFGLQIPSVVVLAHLMLDPARGLLLFAPVILVAAAAWPAARKSLPRHALVTLIAAPLALIAVYSGYPNWHGGWNIGPRYIVAAIPFLLFPLTFAAPSRLAAILVGAGAAAVVPVALTFPFPDRSFILPSSTLALPLLQQGLVAPNLLHFVAGPLAIAVPFALVIAALVIGSERRLMMVAGAAAMMSIGLLTMQIVPASLTQRLRVSYIEEVYFEQPGAMSRQVPPPIPPRAIARAERERKLPPTSWPF